MNLQELDSEDLAKHFECGICNNLMIEPITLFCQHTYCKKCLVEHKKKSHKCPVCTAKFFLPPEKVHNYTIANLTMQLFPEEHKERNAEIDKEKVKKDLMQEIREELRNEIYATIMDSVNQGLNPLLPNSVDELNMNFGGLPDYNDIIYNPNPFNHVHQPKPSVGLFQKFLKVTSNPNNLTSLFFVSFPIVLGAVVYNALK